MESAEGSPFLALLASSVGSPLLIPTPGGYLEPQRSGRRVSQSGLQLAVDARGDARAPQKEEDQRTWRHVGLFLVQASSPPVTQIVASRASPHALC